MRSRSVPQLRGRMVDRLRHRPACIMISTIAVDTLPGLAPYATGDRLLADTLPATLYGSHLRSILSLPQWNMLRAPVCVAARDACEICGMRVTRQGLATRPDCHELWSFDLSADRTPTQKLVRMVALCPSCHDTQHLSNLRARNKTSRAIHHLMVINGWTRQHALDDIERAEVRSADVSTCDWDLDLSVLTGRIALPGFPGLVIPAKSRQHLNR